MNDIWQNIVQQLNPHLPNILEDKIELQSFLNTPTLRIVGPTGMNPSIDLEIESLEGIEVFKNLEFLFVTFHQLTSLEPLSQLEHLKCLFVNDNNITSLKGISHLTDLTSLYIHGNQIESIKEVESLIKLTEISCADNPPLTSFEGITQNHTDLERFIALPNKNVPLAEVRRFEDEIGVRVMRG